MAPTDPSWLIRDETGAAIRVIWAADRDAAIAVFCAPALRPDAYFGPRQLASTRPDGPPIWVGGWTCEACMLVWPPDQDHDQDNDQDHDQDNDQGGHA